MKRKIIVLLLVSLLILTQIALAYQSEEVPVKVDKFHEITDFSTL